MKGLDVSRQINANATQVWSVITNLDGAAEHLSGVKSLERISGPEFGVGTRWRETRKMFGKEATEEMEVASVTPGQAYTVLAESHGSKYHSQLRVKASGGGASVLTMSFNAEPQSFGAKVMGTLLGPLARSATKKAITQDLADIAAAAEALPAD
jgi:carbon monoxide dehydrogenase subunit G